jgi:translation initiation factor 1
MNFQGRASGAPGPDYNRGSDDATMPDDPKTPFHNPFAALGHLRGAGPAPAAPAPAAAPPPGGKTMRAIPRAVVRLERTGRGGKEVTVVEQLPLTPTEREQWLKALKSSLGCGGAIEGDALVIQGDQRTRLPALLTARGVKKVTLG